MWLIGDRDARIKDARITDVDPYIPAMTVATTLHN